MVATPEPTPARGRLVRFGLALTGGDTAAVETALVGLDDADFAAGARRLSEALASNERAAHPVDAGGCLQLIYRGFHGLPPRDRALLVLWTLERLSASEIAAIVDHPEGLVVGRAAEVAAELYDRAMAGGEGCKVLIAEDERITALELKEALEEMGHEVPVVATSAGQAVSAASMHRPVLAILDIRLKGGTDGVSAAREIQETLDIPVVITTAYTDQATRAGSVDPYGFLPKPWSEEDLLRTVQAVLTRIAIERLTPGLESTATLSSPASA